MSTESKVMALLEEGNPATEVDVAAWSDVNVAAWSDIDASTYLATLQDQITPPDASLDDWRWWADWRFATATVALVLMGVAAWFLMNQDGDEAPVVTEPPPSTTSPTATTTPESPDSELAGFWSGTRLTIHLGESEYHILEGGLVTDSGTYEVGDAGELTVRTLERTATCQAGESGEYRVSFTSGSMNIDPIADECGDRRISLTRSSLTPTDDIPIPDSALDVARPWNQGVLFPGRYATTVFQPGFAFELPPGWSSAPAPELESAFAMDRPQAWLVFLALGSDTVEERVAFFRDHDNVSAGEPVSVEIGGFDGVTFDFNVTNNVNLFRVSGGSGEATPEETVRAWIVDVDGTVVTIFFGSTRSTFASLVEDGNAVVASIVWGDAG